MTSDRNIHLDCVRAIAAGEVLVWHSDLAVKHFSPDLLARTWYAPFGGFGVQLFFIVSGYIICSKLEQRITAISFLVSRMLRIVPMYWIFTTLTILVGLTNKDWKFNGYELDFTTITASYLILPQSWFPILGVGWTLEHEMIFYIAVALLLATGVTGKLPLITFGVGLIALGLVGAVTGVDPGHGAWYQHPISVLMASFGFGWLYHCCERSTDNLLSAAVLIAVAVLASLSLITDRQNDQAIVRTLAALAIFLPIMKFHRYLYIPKSCARMISLIGLSSFSIYLSHWFVLSPIGKIFGKVHFDLDLQILVRLSAILIAVAIGVIIFLLVEQPLDRILRKRRPSERVRLQLHATSNKSLLHYS